ncbi:hypothetical protein [Streptomyces ureilyticus]|uniref:Uncharacterized protein n=1 Tax=Streptomyces ureilyticus TaxID=1775131 RepID=A0ABX0DWA7_9ACTN|nr:hypothetical protein [Streptomyces ureilyticus]NGO46210.1 hypothetical protein [Streptomyces ureilyticus]
MLYRRLLEAGFLACFAIGGFVALQGLLETDDFPQIPQESSEIATVMFLNCAALLIARAVTTRVEKKQAAR